MTKINLPTPPVIVYQGSGSDDSAAILSAFNAMKVSSHAGGTLKLVGQIALNTQLVLDLGYSDVNDTSDISTGAPFVLDGYGASVTLGSSVGQGIIVKNGYTPEIKLIFEGGAQTTSFTDAAMTSGSNILTTTSTTMTSSWVGRVVVVMGADAQSGYLISVVDTFTDSHHVVLRRQATATVSTATAQSMVVGLHYENLAAPMISVRGQHVAGCLLHADCMDGSGNSNNALNTIDGVYPELYAQDCSMLHSFTGINGGHTFLNVWNDLNGTTGTGLIGAHFTNCADVAIRKYEGGRSTTSALERINLLCEGMNNGNHGAWAIGDRDTECQVKIVGNMTLNGQNVGSDFGSIQRLRMSCYSPNYNLPAFDGVHLVDVSSMEIDNLNTFRCNRALYAIGSNVRVKRHSSMGDDSNPIVIEADSFNNAPIVDVRGHWRLANNQVALIQPTAVFEVDTVTITGTPTGGTFTRTFAWNGDIYTTAAIARNATASAVASAVQAAVAQNGKTLPATSVTGSGGPLPGSVVTLTFSSGITGSVSDLFTVNNLTGGTSPAVTVARTTAGQAKSANQTAMNAGGNSPGYIRLHGIIDSPNAAGASGVYAIDQQDSGSTTVILDVADLTLLHRNTLAGAINHAGGADLIRNVTKARLENSLVHGVAPTSISNPGSGTPAQNATSRTATMYLVLQFSVASGAANAEAEVYIGPTNSLLTANRIIDDYVQAPSAGTTVLTKLLTFQLKPWWWWSWSDDATVTFRSCVAVYD